LLPILAVFADDFGRFPMSSDWNEHKMMILDRLNKFGEEIAECRKEIRQLSATMMAHKHDLDVKLANIEASTLQIPKFGGKNNLYLILIIAALSAFGGLSAADAVKLIQRPPQNASAEPIPTPEVEKNYSE
jgi:hypothetical protein